MAKRSKLLAALDAHRGKDYKLEKQKKLQKRAIKEKNSKLRFKNAEVVDEETALNCSTPQLEAESDGWESDGSEDAGPAAVCRRFLNNFETKTYKIQNSG